MQLNLTICLSTSQSVCQSVCQSVSQSVSQPATVWESVSQLINHSKICTCFSAVTVISWNEIFFLQCSRLITFNNGLKHCLSPISWYPIINMAWKVFHGIITRIYSSGPYMNLLKKPLWTKTGPASSRWCQHRLDVGPVLVHNGIFTG